MSSKQRFPTVLVIVLVVMLLSFAVGSIARLFQVGQSASASATPGLPAFKHIFVIVLENKEYEQVIGIPHTPYLNALAGQFGLATNSYAIRHPSLPNYLALTGGDTFGVNSDCTDCWIDGPNLIDQLEAAGRSWKAYMEAMPSPCFIGDAGEQYRQKHNPFIYYNNVRNNPERCNKIVPFDQFASDLKANALPEFVWITPDMCNDAHDCKIASADTWLKRWLPTILDSPAWKDQGVVFITFDEGNSSSGCCQNALGGRIATLVISPLVRPGFQSDVAYSHYSLLRTIEAAWNLPLLGNANCDCTSTMEHFFQAAKP